MDSVLSLPAFPLEFIAPEMTRCPPVIITNCNVYLRTGINRVYIPTMTCTYRILYGVPRIPNLLPGIITYSNIGWCADKVGGRIFCRWKHVEVVPITLLLS